MNAVQPKGSLVMRKSTRHLRGRPSSLLATSEPQSGSETPTQPIRSPAMDGARNCFLSSSEPYLLEERNRNCQCYIHNTRKGPLRSINSQRDMLSRNFRKLKEFHFTIQRATSAHSRALWNEPQPKRKSQRKTAQREEKIPRLTGGTSTPQRRIED